MPGLHTLHSLVRRLSFDPIVGVDAPAGEVDLSAAPGPLGVATSIVPYLLMFAVIYFMMVRPGAKQRRDHQTMLEGLKKDDEVLTSGGVYGRIVLLEEKTATLEVADRVKIRILRDRIAGRVPDATAQTLTTPQK